MIELKPKIENCFICPECKSGFPAINDIMIHCAHAMADCTCNTCHFQFYQIFPTGHNVEDQLSIGKTDARYYRSPETEPWLFDSVVKANEGIDRKSVV